MNNKICIFILTNKCYNMMGEIMKIGFLGTGAYAIALSHLIKNDINITMWTKFEDEKTMLLENRENKMVLKNYKFREDIIITNDLEECIKDSNIIIIAIPSKFLKELYSDIKKYIKPNQILCLASKGIDSEGFNTDIIKKYLNNDIVVLSGPTFAVDIINNIPIGLTLASDNNDNIKLINKIFNNVVLETSNDIKGVQLCGAIKNVYAIGMGIIDGLNYPISTKALYLTMCIKEVELLLTKINCNKETILTLAGIGDLYLTCNSENSRNFTFGTMISKNEDFSKYLDKTTVEGVDALKTIQKKIINDINCPIFNAIYNIVYNKASIQILIDTIN